METKNKIGENIAVKRKRAGLTQEELAEKMNVSPQAVSKWENDLSYPDVETLGRLARLFECSLDELVSGKAPAPEVRSAEKEKVERRTMTICVDMNYKEHEGGQKVRLRLPVAVVVRAISSKNIEEMLEEHSELIKTILPAIYEGAVGMLLDVDDGKNKVTIEVEDRDG